MVAFTGILAKIALLALFFGVLTSISLDLLNVIATPLNPIAYKTLVLDVAKTITNSQNTIATSIDEFQTADTAYKSYIVWRIIGCSMITIVFIWVIHKGLKHLVPSVRYDLGTKILIFLLAIGIVWLIGLTASVLSGEGTPSFLGFYNGWVQLVLKREVFIKYVVEQIQKGEFIPDVP